MDGCRDRRSSSPGPQAPGPSAASLLLCSLTSASVVIHIHPPTHAPCCLQLGALSEFRGDWGGAAKMYGEAYSHLPHVLAAPTATPVQRAAEVRDVAECIHVKVC